MASLTLRTEDEVRDGYTPSDGSAFVKGAKQILGFDKSEKGVKQGTGQIKTFNQLGFTGKNDKPDGWYLPNDYSLPAIILETKSESEDIFKQKWVVELFKNIDIIHEKYDKVIGILYNGIDVRVFLCHDEVTGLSHELQHKTYYLKLYTDVPIDKQAICTLTERINDCLHFRLGIDNLYHRMIFTACALVAVKKGASLVKGMNYNLFKSTINDTLERQLSEAKQINQKVTILQEIYNKIEMNTPDNQVAIDDFIGWVKEISDYISSDNWNGEDVMGIFFNEFSRYKGKSEKGQVFTPDHITSFMYKLIHVKNGDRVLDAACGSGAFLVKSMCNMIKENGGISADGTSEICNRLFGIEWSREIYALACANMLIHKDGKTNLEQMDSTAEDAGKWIASKNINKVLMNPPFEEKYGCLKIVQNVLNNVPERTECAFILPDKKLEKHFKDKDHFNKLLKKHTLKKIIKLPEDLFFKAGVTASIFVFEAGIPHGDKEIFACYIEDDGLETVKNKGRQDIKNRWQSIEDRWIKIIDNPVCKEAKEEADHIQSVIPSEHLSYQLPEKPFEIYEEDFIKTMMDYEMFKRGIDVKEFNENLLRKILYASDVIEDANGINITIKGGKNVDED